MRFPTAGFPGTIAAVLATLACLTAVNPPPGHTSPRHPAREHAAAPDPGPPVDGPAQWRWPLADRPQVVRRFDPPAHPWLAGHRGVDLAAQPGEPVLAAGAGTVTFGGSVAGRGVVTVSHPGGLRTTYLPLTPSVSPGSRVNAGDVIGVLEADHGHCPIDCLHWGLRRGPTYLDPLLLLTRPRIRLLPHWTSFNRPGEPDRR